jgi:hypothetical protein
LVAAARQQRRCRSEGGGPTVTGNVTNSGSLLDDGGMLTIGERCSAAIAVTFGSGATLEIGGADADPSPSRAPPR